MKDVYFEPVSEPMLFLVIIIFFMIIFLLVIEPRVFKKKLSNKNEHGSSKFADLKEIKKNFEKTSIDNIDKVGFPVWYEKRNGKFESIYFDTKSPHYLIVGSTGAGKSATVSIPMSIHFATAKEKHSVVITDPKAELFHKCGKIFEENGYDIVTIDFRNPSKSTKINVMQPIIDEWKEHCHFNKCMMFFLSHFIKVNKISLTKMLTNKKYENQTKEKYELEDYIIEIIKINQKELEENIKSKMLYNTNILNKYTTGDIKKFVDSKSNSEILDYIRDSQNNSAKYQAETNRLVITLSNLIFAEKEAKDPFWVNSAKQLFIGITGIFLEDYKKDLIDENKINLSSIKKFQNSSLIKENHLYLQKNLNNRSYGSLSKDYLTSLLSSAENTYKSITAIFAEKMSIFDDLNVENITSTNEFNFTDLGRKPTALFIIVPDEDRTYYSLITVIIGMLIKDLTKFANLPENGGALPVPVEWILDEFANCPPLDSIETVISVARSRKMRFYFFIQSFSQLDQNYGKQISTIIQDNTALIYLKTNTVETASIIEQKLGKATIETGSISMSTDSFKVGASQTKSLMGKELLTATEIISLKYKTIIFPSFSNPIFRDTYMYSIIYPQYKDYPICSRKSKILKRLTDNYYTVEKLKNLYDGENTISSTNMLTKKVEESYQKKTDKVVKRIIKNGRNEEEKESMLFYIQEIRNNLKEKITGEYKNEDGTYTLEVSSLLNKFELSKLKRLKRESIVLEVAQNYKMKKTILSIIEI